MPLTDDARDLPEGTTPGPWEVRDDAGLLAVTSEAGPVAIDMTEADARLIAAARKMAAMIAGMREEWAREARILGSDEWRPIRWCRSREEAARDEWMWSLPPGATVEYRLNSRYVTDPGADCMTPDEARRLLDGRDHTRPAHSAAAVASSSTDGQRLGSTS